MDQSNQPVIPVEEQFRVMADAAPVMIWIAGTDKACYFFNTGWLKFTGRTLEQEYGDGWAEGVHPDDLQRCLEIYTISFDNRAEFKMQYRLKRYDGKYRLLLDHGVPRYLPDGTFAGYIGSCIDIEDLDQLKNEHSETRKIANEPAMLAAIIESSEDAIISKNLNGIITSWNTSAERVFGHTENEVLGKHISIIIPPNRLSEEDVIIGKIRRGEKIDHFETIRLTKSGEEIPISLTVSPIKNSYGQVIGASKIVRDISRQRIADDKLQNYAERLEILNTVGMAISADLDSQNILQRVTDATTQLTGASFGAFFYNNVDENGESYQLFTLSGAPREAFEKFGMPRNTEVFGHTFSGKGIVRADDITKDPRYGKMAPHYGMPPGHLPVVSYLAVPVVSKSEGVIGGLFFGHVEPAKFTKEHEHLVAGVAAQAAVALVNARLYGEIQVLNAKKDEFIGLASHELKTPLTSINGYLQIIERSLGADNRHAYFVNKALQQVNKLTALISDLLDVSKIQTGKLPFSYNNFDLTKLLHDVVEMMQHSNQSHQLELHIDNEQMVLYADQQRIEQVVINLITNAIKYSPDGNKVIIRASDMAGNIQVSVQDFGIGIAKNQQERIFSRFYRVENLAAHMSGLGIGLYISQEIISRHNGKLWVNSTPGEGSIFYFQVPARVL
jgi:PAS domain S-box-containing protein